MITIFTKYNIKEILLIILPFLVFYKFYNFRPIVEMSSYNSFLIVLNLLFLVLIFSCLNKKYSKDSLSLSIKYVLLIIVLNIIPSFLVSGQSLYYSLRGSTYGFSLCMYFWFVYHKISSRSVVQAFLIILISYIVLHLLALSTFPNHLFGYNENLIDRAESDMVIRGVVRIGVPGQDFVILAIFVVLNLSRVNKKYLLFLIPLFVMLILRGTRTPLIITIILSLFYLVWKCKYKILVIIACCLSYVIIPIIYDSIKNSNSENIIVNYVQMTDEQLNSEDEDIRIKMSKYYLFDFNDNILAVLIGNGVPQGNSNYEYRVLKNSYNNAYYLSDVGIVQIYVYYGILGLIAYLLLLIKILRTKVDPKYEFAKLFVMYYYLTLFSGNYLVQNAFYLAFGLYLMEINRINRIKTISKHY